MAKKEIRVAGLGGQGVLLCAMIVGRAASLYGGKNATLIQAFGPEARGSACSAQVMLDDDPIGYPYVKQSDILVAMSQDAYAKFEKELKPGGILIYEDELVKPSAAPVAIAAGIPASRFAEELGRRLVQNIVMVGFFTAVTGLMPKEAAAQAVKDSVPPATIDLNMRAFERGYQHGIEVMAAKGGVPA